MINKVLTKGGLNCENVDKCSEPLRDCTLNESNDERSECTKEKERDRETVSDIDNCDNPRDRERDKGEESVNISEENFRDMSVRKSKRIMEKGVRINYKDMANGTLDKEKSECYSKRVRYFANNASRDEKTIKFKADYASKVTRLGIKYFLEGRCKLFPCKKNFEYLNLKKGLLCRWCERETETEDHVLEKCDKCPFSNLMKSNDFFSDDPLIINKAKNSGTLLYKEYNKRNMKW